MAADDVETAVSELQALPTQARLVSLHAFAWRASAVLTSVAGGASAVVAAMGVVPSDVAIGVTVVALFVPQVLALIISDAASLIPDLRSLIRGNHEQRVRFGIGGTGAYLYYGWRYAFRHRRRPWGALTHEEKLALPSRISRPGCG